MKNYHFTIVVEKDENGYVAFCPQLQGCYAQGDSYEEVMVNIEDAIRLHLEDRIEAKEEWSPSKFLNITSLEIAI